MTIPRKPGSPSGNPENARIPQDTGGARGAIHDDSTRACVRCLGRQSVADGLFPVADERFRHPGEEAIRDALEIHPGADRASVRAYFNFRPAGRDGFAHRFFFAQIEFG